MSAEADILDVAIIGAGPTGLACAIETQRRGLSHVVIEKGCITNSIFHFPSQMVFFTTPELLEIGDLPLVCSREKPSRHEGLKYYRKVVQAFGLNVHQFEEVDEVGKSGGHFFKVCTTHGAYTSRNVVISTGYYDNPNLLGVPGEDLPHVSHYYREAHPFFGRNVVVVGGKNSAVEAALDLFRSGARVTLVHRGAEIGKTVKYWIKPDIENRISRNEIRAYFNAHLLDIREASVRIDQNGNSIEIPTEHVFALTGYHPSTKLFAQLGVTYDNDTLRPTIDPETYETNIPGVYVAGSIVAGRQNGEIFIENGRFHGQVVAGAIAARSRR